MAGLGHSALLALNPEHDPVHVASLRRKKAATRAHEFKAFEAFEVETRAVEKGMRAERVAIARAREREQERDSRVFRSDIRRATVKCPIGD